MPCARCRACRRRGGPALPEQRDPGDPGGVRCVADGCHEPGQHPREACVTVRPKDVQLAVRLRGERH
ncbi:histone H3 [Leishmania panamensis]|uniref:Histone H3 n=72 Tax=Leishmania panamensis TaxID=5679 RepID=A0AC62A5U8_LEIPA